MEVLVMMHLFVAYLTKIETDQEEALREKHVAFLNDLTAKGRIAARGPFLDGSGGLVIYRASDEASAFELASGDPFVVGGARSLVLKPWKGTFPDPEDDL
jgi:hypothetical protein